MAMRRASLVVSTAPSASEEEKGGDAFSSTPVEILPKEIDLAGDTDEKLPNTLVVTVIQAHKLQTAALRNTLSCYVKLTSLGREFKTSVASKSDEPFWNETFSFRAIDWASSVTLSVRDKINVKMRFLGQVRISCTDVAALPGMATQTWFPLRDKNWERRPGIESEIELKVALVYTKRNDPTLSLELGEGEDEDEVVGVAADQDDETEEEAFARRKELERLENERKNTLYAGINQGDYQIQVHVIEARDLKGENLSGTSDPFVQVDVMGHKKKTSTKYETLGCVFDEILFFHFKNIGRNEIKQASIKLSIYDKEHLRSDKLIGSYQLDCLSVYFRPHHELYRQWVAVHDHLNENDRGIQGFLLISITIIGPGDTFIVHDREAELAKELVEAAQAALLDPKGKASASSNFSTATLMALNPEGQSLILLPPTIDLKLHFLVVKVFKAEDLPPMDSGLLIASGIDAFVQIGFGANAACRSSVVTVKGVANLSPEFLEEIWIPVMAPTLCRHVSISVWDRDIARKDELVGITSHDYQLVASASSPGGILAAPESKAEAEARLRRELESLESTEASREKEQQEQVTLRWFNLYGPPLKRINKKRGAWIAQNPECGSTYRGRVLLSMERVEKTPPEESEKFHIKRMKETSLAVLESLIPKTVKYVLRCALFCGADLPTSTSTLPGPSTSSSRVRVSVSIGSYEIHFEPMTVDKSGAANWEVCKEKWPIILPADLTQLPDIIVTLSRQSDKDTFVSISFARFRASVYFQQGFNTKCQWIQLQEDVSRRQTRYALDKTQSPGSLLLQLGFGREEVAVRTPWGNEEILFRSFRHHRVHREVRVHVFQFRKLCLPEEKVKMPRPFVSVHCCGQVKKTQTKSKTLDPLFYETLVFVTHVPHDLEYSPDIVLYAHDANVSPSTSPSLSTAILGELRIPMTKAQRAVANASPHRPSWFPLTARSNDLVGTGTSLIIDEPRGEALVSIQYIDSQEPIQTVFPPDPMALHPEYEEANLEIIAIGVRKLKARSLLGIRNSQVECELTGGVFLDGTTVWRSKPATSTSGKNGKNANLLERAVLPAKLPVDTLYAPQLTIRVVETTVGGLRKTLLASSIVDLGPKLPWSANYAPQLLKQPAFELPPAAVGAALSPDASKQSDRRKSVFGMLQRLGERRKSQTKQEPVDDPLSDEEYEQQQPEGEVSVTPVVEMDDGLGVGEIPRPSDPGLWVNPVPSQSQLQDPAVKDQLVREEQRRYMAGQADLLRGGKGTRALMDASVYDVPGSSAGVAITRADLTGKPFLSDTTTAPYQEGRDWWINSGGEELEKYFQGKALETYPLFRPVLTRPSLLQRKRVRVQVKAGIFKGLITVTEKRKRGDQPSPSSLVDLQRLKEPQSLVVRVYVLRGYNLQAKDLNGFSDPYLRLKLGKDIQSDRANYKKKTLNPEFFKMYTFHTKLPGASQLEIGVWDHDLVKATDDFIGSTTIDLEDRWYHREWQRLDSPGSKTERAQNNLTRIPVKPIEHRHLYTPKRATSQGLLQVWVDILTAQQHAVLPPTNIELPEPKKFEVRVVIWRAENVTDQEGSDINDYFVKVWMEGGKPQSTDVHWRCSSGKPSWNWRFKLPTEYPMRTPEFGRLHIQLWDKDVLKWNDVIGEAQLDLYKWIRRAAETNRTVAPFLELKTLAQQQQATSEAADPKESNAQEKEDDDDDDDEDDDDGSDLEAQPVGRGHKGKENQSLLMRHKRMKSTKASKLLGKLIKPKFMDKDVQKTKQTNKRKTKEARDANEARLAINGFLDLFGMGNLDDDAEWIPITYTDRESAKTLDMGRIGVSIQIVPSREAELNPVGKGQESPNVNPYLPPPVGRLRLTANPIMMLKQLMSLKAFASMMAVCCCLCCVMFLGVFGSTIFSALTFYETWSRHSEGGLEIPNYPYQPAQPMTTGVYPVSPPVTTSPAASASTNTTPIESTDDEDDGSNAAN